MKSKGSKTKQLRFERLEGRRVLSASPGLHAGIQLAPAQTATSTNWSGYADVTPTRNSVSAVSGSWNVPLVTPNGSQTAYAAVWVGIDGYNDATVEQTGTLSYVTANNVVTNYAWYEMYPSGMVEITSTTTNRKTGVTTTTDPVNPGDAISASVNYNTKAGTYTLSITDSTAPASTAPNAPIGWTYTTTQSIRNADRTSAEWIVEAPSSGNRILPLANFQQPITFTDAQATISGTTGPIDATTFPSAVYVSTITMVTNFTASGVPEDSVGALADTTSTTNPPVTTSSFTVTDVQASGGPMAGVSQFQFDSSQQPSDTDLATIDLFYMSLGS